MGKAKPKELTEAERRRQEIEQLEKRAERGDKTALPAVREYLDSNHEVAELAGNMARQVELSWRNTFAGDNLLVQEGVNRKLAALKAELAGPNPTPLERLLVERIAACWLQVQYADALFAQKIKDSLSWEAVRGYQAWQDRAHKRFLSAVKALALLRRFAIPAVQVNIADKQINVA